jgi:hypothetical protein
MPDETLRRLKPFIERIAENPERFGGGRGGGFVGTGQPPHPFGPFPPPVPFAATPGGASYSALGEGATKMECWSVTSFEGEVFVNEAQMRYHDTVIHRRERWNIGSHDRIIVTEAIAGPGHDSSRTLEFSRTHGSK